MIIERLRGKPYIAGTYYEISTHRSKARGRRCFAWRSGLKPGWSFRVEFPGSRRVEGTGFMTRRYAADAALLIAHANLWTLS